MKEIKLTFSEWVKKQLTQEQVEKIVKMKEDPRAPKWFKKDVLDKKSKKWEK